MNRQSGFSMIELLIAMTVTLIVSGAIYGLLTSGGTAFRREPELADRQQNVRVAMDLITRDVFNAGAALPTFSQVFTRVDPAGANCSGPQGLNGCGVEGSMGATAAAARAPADGGDPSTATDVLEIVTTEETCPHRTVCSRTDTGAHPLPGLFGHYIIREDARPCIAGPGMAMLTDGDNFAVQMTLGGATPDGACPGPFGGPAGDQTNNGDLQLSDGLPPWTTVLPNPSRDPPPPTGSGLPVVFLYSGRVVRYRIAPNPGDPLDPGPALWRSRTGRYGTDAAAKLEPGDGGFPSPSSPWELVARGIEDLQVEYLWGDGLWHNRPMTSTAGDWNSLMRRVRITLSARASGQNLQGATTAAGTGPDAVRGLLVTEVAPRAIVNELQMCLAHPTTPCPPASHIQ
jgi:prepilin-type N-terminal cleavage/methylation domain-containing protein